jgi:hypothetical protein
MITIAQLEKQILKTEKIFVRITSDEPVMVRPYPLNTPSPSSMKVQDLLAQLSKMYPELDFWVDVPNLTLAQLRTRHAP